MRYLWIDRYCIDQFDATEKQVQINNMDSVYSGSTLTVIAPDRNAESGLPGVKSRPRNASFVVRIGDTCVMTMPPFPRWQISRSTWRTRAWTYQEGIFSHSCLVFLEDQVYFECNHMACLESLQEQFDVHRNINDKIIYPRLSPSFQSIQLPPGPFAQGDWMNTYYDLLEQYGSMVDIYFTKSLTFQGDALNAFAGIGRCFANNVWGLPQICGVPLLGRQSPQVTDLSRTRLNLFISSLIWTSTLYLQQRRPGFPSWSWAGWSGDRASRFRTKVDRPALETFRAVCRNVMFEYPDGRVVALDDIPANDPQIMLLEARPLKLPATSNYFPPRSSFDFQPFEAWETSHADQVQTSVENINNGKWNVFLYGECMENLPFGQYTDYWCAIIVEKTGHYATTVGSLMIDKEANEGLRKEIFESRYEQFRLR